LAENLSQTIQNSGSPFEGCGSFGMPRLRDQSSQSPAALILERFSPTLGHIRS